MPPSAEPVMQAALGLCNHGLRNSGGIERYALTLVRGLHQRGIRPTLIAKAFDTALPEYRWVDPVHVHIGALPNKLRDLYFDWRIGHTKRHLGQTRWSDIGICGSTHPGFLEAMGRTAGRSDRWKIALERAHLEASCIVVAHSRRMQREAVRWYGIDPGKVRLLYPPVDAARFAPVDRAERERLRMTLGLPTDRAVFLLASTGHARKGLERLERLFAATELPATLVVAGRPLERELPNVRGIGYRTDIENVYRAVDYTVMASHYEPFGLVGVESVMCGTPVLLADNVGCAEVIGGGAKIEFALDEGDGLQRAIVEAVGRWHAGAHRLDQPLGLLSYDPNVAVHLDVLLGLAATLTRPR